MGRRAMLVEDDAAFRQGLEEVLRQAGWEVLAFPRFEPARAWLEHERPDLLLTDIRLGPFNGLQLVLLARGLPEPVPCVVFSAFDDALLRAEACRQGARYLPKPVSVRELLLVIADLAPHPALAEGSS